jgi:hypothetical protein
MSSEHFYTISVEHEYLLSLYSTLLWRSVLTRGSSDCEGAFTSSNTDNENVITESATEVIRHIGNALVPGLYSESVHNW